LEQGGHGPGLRLEQQMLTLVSSSQTLQSQYLQLQNVLQEANIRSRQRNEEIERLRSESYFYENFFTYMYLMLKANSFTFFVGQLVESQQSEKQSRNEAEKLRVAVQSLEDEVTSVKQLSGKALQEDNKKNEELQHSQQECKSLQNWISIMEDELKT
jgi:hypothetical protein